MFRRARLAGLTSRNGYDWLREKSQCTLSVCRLRNKKHMDNTTQGSPGHLTLTSRESGASIQSFLDESFHFVAASLGDIVGSPTSADLSLDVAHAEICLVVTLQCLGRRGGTWGRSSNCPRRTVVPQCEGRRGDRAQEPRTSRHVSAGRPGHGDRRTGAGGRHSGSSGHLNIRSVSCLADWVAHLSHRLGSPQGDSGGDSPHCWPSPPPPPPGPGRQQTASCPSTQIFSHIFLWFVHGLEG